MTMSATLIASTAIYPDAMRKHGFEPHKTPDGNHPTYPEDIDVLAEFAGRACYESFHRPNPKTASTWNYLNHIVEVGHFSVLEHGSATFYLTGVSRSLTHELIRHRHFSYSQLSQRYVPDTGEIVEPPDMQGDEQALSVLRAVRDNTQTAYAVLAEHLEENLPPEITGTARRKRARQAARAVLPNATETRIVVTGNLRAWREFFAKRYHDAADEEIKELAGLVLDQLRPLAPGSLQDIDENPVGDPKSKVTADELQSALVAEGLDPEDYGPLFAKLFG